MSANLPPDFCPYKGLQPYTEQDQAFFFGRDRDQEIIISNLYAASVTVFYGASGVGKSSVLLAGSVPLLRKERNLAVVVFRSWQNPDFLAQLKDTALKTVSQAFGKEISVDPSLPLDAFLAAILSVARGSIFFIFDQFEEYFLYNPAPSAEGGFEAEFARSVNRRDVTANFLLSMREDSLSKLDRFQGRIPTLLNNMLRLEHLDFDAAKVAITQPLEEYNRLSGQPPMTIEPGLVRAILNDLQGAQAGEEQLEQGLARSSAEGSTAPIETPFLQMVLTRLWDEERAAGSTTLRMQTFEALGRAANIARTHLDTMMARLTDAERDTAATILRYLVTPSGTKIAQEAGALASWTDLTEAQAQSILTRLSGPDMRILRTMQAPGQPVLYEIFHDVLAQAVLNWRRRYVATQDEDRIRREEQERTAKEQEEAERRREKERGRLMRRALMALSVLLVVMGLAVGVAIWKWRQANNEADRANKETKRANDTNAKLKAEVDSRNFVRQGVVYSQKERFAEAIQQYELALQSDPDNLNAYSNKGYAQMRLGDSIKDDVALKQKHYEESIKTLQHLTTRDSTYPIGHYNLALSLHKAGREKEAVQEASTVLTLDSDFCKTFRYDSNFRWFLTKPEFLATCNPSATPSPTPASTPSPTPASTPSRTPSSTPSSTPSRTPARTPSGTPFP